MTLENISALLAAGHLPTVWVAQQLAAALGYDPSQLVIPCEAPGCANTVPLGQSHSFISCYATTGPAQVPAFQCGHEQHYGCSLACAIAALNACITDHLLPAHARAQVVDAAASSPAMLPAPQGVSKE